MSALPRPLLRGTAQLAPMDRANGRSNKPAVSADPAELDAEASMSRSLSGEALGEDEVEAEGVCTRSRALGIALGLAALVTIVMVAKLTGALHLVVDAVMVGGPKVVRWVHDHPGYVVLLLATIALLDTVPGVGHMLAKPLQYALPWIFGYPPGAVMIFMCLYTSLTLQFVFGRYLLHDCVRNRIGNMRLFIAIDRALSRERGLLLVCLLRANILLPEVLTSYVLSVTRLSPFNYCLGSLVECAKNVPMQLYIAYTIDAGSKAVAAGGAESRGTLIQLLVGGIIAAATLLVVARLVNRELERHGIESRGARPSIMPSPFVQTEALPGTPVDIPRSQRCWRAIKMRLAGSMGPPQPPPTVSETHSTMH